MIEQYERQTLRPGAPRPECNLSQNRPERREVLGPHLLLASLLAHRTRESSTLFNQGSSPPWTNRRKEIQGDADLEVSEGRPEWVRILRRFLWYTGAGLLVSSIAALAVRLWLPESSHMPLFILVHSLCIGVALMLLIRSVDTAKTGST